MNPQTVTNKVMMLPAMMLGIVPISSATLNYDYHSASLPVAVSVENGNRIVPHSSASAVMDVLAWHEIVRSATESHRALEPWEQDLADDIFASLF